MTAEGRALGEEVVDRLVRGRDLDPVGLGEIDGRLDLRGFAFPQVAPARSDLAVVGSFEVAGGWVVPEIRSTLKFKSGSWTSLDLTGAYLGDILLMGMQLSNCVFEGADLTSTGFFGSSVEHSSFARANVRRAGSGGSYKRRFNVFDHCDFPRARLDASWIGPATFTDCDFSDAKLKKTEFWACTLVRCKFAGELREVIFHRQRVGTDPEGAVLSSEPRLEDLDLRETNLRWCSFDGFDLDGVHLPERDPGLVVIEDYDAAVDRALARLDQIDVPIRWRRRARAQLEIMRREALPGTRLGMFNRSDFEDEAFSNYFVRLFGP
jgi:uncharacterized protein YjbI with pentapeptide repeats